MATFAAVSLEIEKRKEKGLLCFLQPSNWQCLHLAKYKLTSIKERNLEMSLVGFKSVLKKKSGVQNTWNELVVQIFPIFIDLGVVVFLLVFYQLLREWIGIFLLHFCQFFSLKYFEAILLEHTNLIFLELPGKSNLLKNYEVGFISRKRYGLQIHYCEIMVCLRLGSLRAKQTHKESDKCFNFSHFKHIVN